MKHLGDITKLNGAEIPVVDIITGGSPCQDLSIAGLRKGIKHEENGDEETTRSGLFMDQLRIVKEMRESDRRKGRHGVDVRPRYMVWENVPGAFSSNGGKDFQAVLTEIARIAEPDYPDVPMPERGGWPKAGCIFGQMGNWSIAYRVHDAQYWGVPQRRKRIALLADFNGLTAPEILFDPQLRGEAEDSEPDEAVRDSGTVRRPEVQPLSEGLSGDLEPRGETGQETTGAAGGGVEGASGCLTGWDVQSKRIFSPDGKSGTLNSGTTEGMNIVPSVLAYGISSYDSNAMKSPNPHSGIYEADTARTLDLNGGSPACNQGGIAVVQPSYCLQGNGIGRSDNAGCNGKGWTEEVSYTLNTIDRPAVVQSVGCDVYNQEVTGDVAASLTAASGGTNTSGPKVLAYGFEPGAAKRLDTENRPTDMTNLVIGTYQAVTGDHQNRVTDYTALCVGNGQLNQMSMAEQANTLDTMHDQQAVMVAAVDCRNGTENPNINGTLQAKSTGGTGTNFNNVLRANAIVRRLTPLECERLQGYPDGWSDIGDYVDENGRLRKEVDTAKYKAAGNSIALPFWAWLFRRINAHYERQATMGSLFDGIGGFPLTALRSGIKPLWASEIEAFPIAVCKKHFGDEDAGIEGDVWKYL